MQPNTTLLLVLCMLACTTIAELDPGIQGRDLFVPLQQDQLHEPPLGQQRFHLPWLRNPFHQRPVTTDDNNDGRFPLFHIPRPSSSPPRQKERQTFQLDHIFVHGAPRSRYRHVFKRLQVNSRIRQEMTHARASFISNEIKTAVSRQPPSLSPSSHEPGEEQWLLRVDDTLTVNNLFKYGVQSVTQHDNEEEEKEKETTTTAFPWPRPRVPDVQDQETIKSFARMALDCYVDPARQGWVDIGDPWDVSMDIGWMESGLRGYVFASEDKKTVIVGIKGTSLKLFGTGGGPTANNDKLNDNKMFSCCCGKVDRTWWGVCGCYMGGNQCNQQCLVDDLTKDREESESYVGIGMKVIDSIHKLYPDATIWLTGHSLGGSVASILGITYKHPVVAFQAPGDRLYAERIHLVKQGLSPPQLTKYPVWHIGPTADPIYMGTCNGPTSTCYTAGYAMESRCHLGKVCRYDTMGELGWRQGIQHHTILAFIDVVDQWQNLTKGREIVPPCEAQGDCQDCTQWDYV